MRNGNTLNNPVPGSRRVTNLVFLILSFAVNVAFPVSVDSRLVPYAPPSVRPYMMKYGLKGYRYMESEKVKGADLMSFLLFSPHTGNKSLPMVVYLPGRGERGDLALQFRARTIFDSVTSETFQRRHPCHLLAISPPRSARTLWGGMPGSPSARQRRVYALINSAISLCAKPSVDTNRLYLTGFSYGGNGVYCLAC